VATAPEDLSAVACSFRINESTVCCVAINMLPNVPHPVGARFAMSACQLGNNLVDMGVRFDYLFVCGPIGDILNEAGEARTVMTDLVEPAIINNRNGDADVPKLGDNLRIAVCSRPINSRFDVKTYSCDASVLLPHVSVSGDIFSRRFCLPVVPFKLRLQHQLLPSNFRLRISDLSFHGYRVPNFSQPRLEFTTDWTNTTDFGQTPLIVPMMATQSENPQVSSQCIVDASTFVALSPTYLDEAFLRLQHIDVTVFGKPDVSDGTDVVPLCSGALMLKGAYDRSGAPMPFTVRLFYRTLAVATLHGCLTADTLREGM
jgi:hypothetical protein